MADIEKYNKCVDSCELGDIYTQRALAEIYNRDIPKGDSEVHISIETLAKQDEETCIMASLTASVEGRVSEGSDPSWLIEVNVMAEFRIPKGLSLSDEELQLFSEKQSLLTLLPYVRADVSSLAAQCGLGSITLPLMHPKQTLKKEE